MNFKRTPTVREGTLARCFRRLRFPSLMVGVLLAAGCAPYQFRDAAGLYPAEFKSVSVDIAANRPFWRGSENDLTEAVIKEIMHRTPYVVKGKSGADSQLKLTIVRIDQNMISRRFFGAPQEMEFTMTVDMEWQDAVTGRNFRSLKGLSAPGRYIPARGGQELHQVAQRKAAERLARDIVDAMRSEW